MTKLSNNVCQPELSRVHTDTSTSPGSRVRVIVNTSLHVFQ